MAAAAASLHDAFVAHVATLKHDRLKEAVQGMLAVTPAPRHELAELEGAPSPEKRLVLHAELEEDLRARFPDALVLKLARAQLGLEFGSVLVSLLTPPLRSPVIFTHLRYVDVCDNSLTDQGRSQDVLRKLLYQLSRAPSLSVLLLHGNMLLSQGAVSVARLLRCSTSLEALDLSRNNLGDRGAEALNAGVTRDRDFDADAILQDATPSDAVEAVEVAPTAAPAPEAPKTGRNARPGSARAMTASGKPLVRPASATPASAAAAVPVAPVVRVEAGDDTSGGMLKRVSDGVNESLVWLDLSENNLTGFGLEPLPACSLVRSLCDHPRLRYLDLSRNRLTRAVMTSLNIGLELNKSLVTLILDGNDIDAAPAAAMADILHGHSSLSHLSLRYNRVRSDGAISFARLLAAKGGLLHLDLRDNYIGEHGTRAVLEAMGVATPASVTPLEMMTAREGEAAAPRDPVPDSAREAPQPEAEAVVAGSGAAAILALRRAARGKELARRRSVAAGGDAKLDDAPSPTSPAPAIDSLPMTGEPRISEDGVIMRVMPALEAVAASPVSASADAPPPAVGGMRSPIVVSDASTLRSSGTDRRVRAVLMDADAVDRVMRRGAHASPA